MSNLQRGAAIQPRMTRKTLLAIAAAGFAATAAAQTPFQGSWTIEPARWKSEQAAQAAADERIYLQMRRDEPDNWSNWGTTVARAAFSGPPWPSRASSASSSSGSTTSIWCERRRGVRK